MFKLIVALLCFSLLSSCSNSITIESYDRYELILIEGKDRTSMLLDKKTGDTWHKIGLVGEWKKELK